MVLEDGDQQCTKDIIILVGNARDFVAAAGSEKANPTLGSSALIF